MFSKKDHCADVGFKIMEGAAITSGIVTPIKFISGRSRPNQGVEQNHFSPVQRGSPLFPHVIQQTFYFCSNSIFIVSSHDQICLWSCRIKWDHRESIPVNIGHQAYWLVHLLSIVSVQYSLNNTMPHPFLTFTWD